MQPAQTDSFSPCAGGILHVKFVTALPSRLNEVDESHDAEHGDHEQRHVALRWELHD
jgi:hypothetical protein